jgi:hypothetical protein
VPKPSKKKKKKNHTLSTDTGLGHRKIFGIDTSEGEGKTLKEEDEDKEDT